MRVELVEMGDSQAIRLPRSILEEAQLADEIDVQVVGNAIVIRSATQPRNGWEQAAAACRIAGDDEMDDWISTLSDFEGEW